MSVESQRQAPQIMMGSTLKGADPRVLERKVPSNPKFRNVGSKLNTGPNMRNVLRQYEGTSGPNARNKKRDEFFQRLRPSTLGKLLEPALESEESVYRLGHEDTASVVSVVDSVRCLINPETPHAAGSHAVDGHWRMHVSYRPQQQRQRATCSSTTFAVSSGSTNATSSGRSSTIHGSFQRLPTTSPGMCTSTRCLERLILLGRAALTPSILSHRATLCHSGAEARPIPWHLAQGPVEGGKMIVLYDEDGKTAPAVGNAFVEKGIENTYVLNGGFLGACAGCPAMLMGQPPSPDDLAAMMQAAHARSLRLSSSLTPLHPSPPFLAPPLSTPFHSSPPHPTPPHPAFVSKPNLHPSFTDCRA